MANWNKHIRVEVKLPYITQGCTLDYFPQDLDITHEDIWISGHNKEALCWKAYFHVGEYPILIMGKATTKDGKNAKTTTYKLSAWCSVDGTNKGKEQYECRIISFH